MSKSNLKPERTDTFYMTEVLKASFNARIGLLIVTLVVVCLLFAIFLLVSRPDRVVVIDRATGQTFSSVSQQGITEDLIDRQLVYYTSRSVEHFFNFDHNAIQNARRELWNLASVDLRTALGEKYLDGTDVRECIRDKVESFVTWEIHPRITRKNDPYYSVFGTLQRVLRSGGSTREVKKFSVRVDWGRLNNNVDFTRRPHALVLLKIQILNEGSAELNEQLNLFR